MITVEVEVEAQAWTEALPNAEALVRTAAEAAARLDGPQGEGDYVVLLTDDAAIAKLNADFRGRAGPTNVLSFPAAEAAAPHRGDIALAYETCAREAEGQGKTLVAHLQHLTVHGVLHLLGFDHHEDDEAEAMEGRERQVLATLGIGDPYAERAGAA